MIKNQFMDEDNPRVYFRLFLIATCFALTGSVASLTVAAGSLVGHAIAANKALATLPLVLKLVGTMTAGFPASLLMRKIGRRNGFIIGTFLGLIGALSGGYAILISHFALFCASTFILGAMMGFNQLYRFAAVEVAGADFKAKAVSLVMVGGIVSGTLGPFIAAQGKDWIDHAPFAGGYLAVAGVYVVVVTILIFMDLPRPTQDEKKGQRRKFEEIATQHDLILAVVSASVSYAVMAFIMTATPLAMNQREYAFADTALVIQGHVMGMFLPSFFTGSLIQRFGAPRMIAAGIVLNLVCIAINLHGETWWHFWTSLLFLGIGWNFMFISGTTLLTETYRPAEKAWVQGSNDFLVFAMAASGSLLAGVMLNLIEWKELNLVAVPLLLVSIMTLVWHQSRKPSESQKIPSVLSNSVN